MESIAVVPDRVLAALERARRGVVVLACDGLSHRHAAPVWPVTGELAAVWPSVSTTAWLTATTGVGPEVHGVAGMVYRVPGHGLVLALDGTPLDDPAADPVAATVAEAPPTVFERAAARGARPVAIGREIAAHRGPWPAAVLRGAVRPAPTPLTTDPAAAARAAVSEVDGALAAADLVWAYVNLDDSQHRHGWTAAADEALRVLDGAARRWADRGWTVIAHSDHGHARHRSDPGLAAAWAAVDTPALCELPSGGAGRTRWLHPRPGRTAEVADRLRDALGDSATVHRAEELATGRALERVGAVVAVAASERFPVLFDWMVSEHGGTHPDETRIPYAVWTA
jgi:hypothetical protein